MTFMAQFIIHGGKPLEGSVTIQGSKNTALPLIAATLLTEEPCVIENIPSISDVATMAAIAEKLGASVSGDISAHRLVIQARSLTNASPDETLSRHLRGSILFAGSLLGRLKRAEMPYPGGDAIGARPLATHLHALEALGVSIEENGRLVMDGRNLSGSIVTLEEPSVTATETALLVSVLAPGRTLINLPAFEPHIQELVVFLRAMGADIRWPELDVIEINGVPRLRGAAHRLNPDELEISSFATLAAATRSEIALHGITPRYLAAVFLQLKKMGVAFELDGAALRLRKPSQPYKSFRVQSGLYPKLGSDHLPPFAVLATQAEGASLIHDWLYENRLRYVPELQKMGAACTILDPHRAIIIGPTPLSGCEIESLDIRSGMTLVIASLVAEGRSIISRVEHIDRGYEQLEERLRAIGADIQRLKDDGPRAKV